MISVIVFELNLSTLYKYLFSCHGKWSIKPTVKRATRLEDTGQQEIQQGPQLRQFVLKKKPINFKH